MSHDQVCITNVLDDIRSCTIRGEHLLTCNGHHDNGKECKGCQPRPATRGEVCERCYADIDHAIQVAANLRHRLAGIDHAITAENVSSIPGPRIPLTAIRLALDEIWSYQQHGSDNPTEWVATEHGAATAVRFAAAVRRTERAHPTLEREKKLKRLRCPNCNRLTATWQPPDWPGDDVTIACIAPGCGWEATNPDAMNIVTAIELHGPINILAAARKAKGAA